MKKFGVSLVIVGMFIFYSVMRVGLVRVAPASAGGSDTGIGNVPSGSSGDGTSGTGTSGSSSSSSNSSSTGYKDGSYTGSQADAQWGIIQVRAIIQNGKISDVQVLQYPNERSRSQYINSFALPQLKSEVIQAQSAQVDIVSGATDTSEAYMQSLGDALTQAHAA